MFMTQQYEITANILCHDIRLNTSVSIILTLDQPPSPATVQFYVYQVADPTVEQAGGEGCPYDVSEVKVRVLSQGQ